MSLANQYGGIHALLAPFASGLKSVGGRTVLDFCPAICAQPASTSSRPASVQSRILGQPHRRPPIEVTDVAAPGRPELDPAAEAGPRSNWAARAWARQEGQRPSCSGLA